MLIIGAGWGRTGTTSATAALELLGAGPCVHMKRMWDSPDVAATFLRYLDGGSVDWSTALEGWNSGVDWPVCWVWRELAEAYPDAPVLLTTRDPDAWYDSVIASIHGATAADSDVGPFYMRALLDAMWDRDFGGWAGALDRDATISRFRAHDESVRRECPPDRLVEWQVSDGWGPLCDALGVPVPAEPFPHLNSQADFARRVAETDQ